MNRPLIREAVRSNWYLIVALLVVLASMPLFALRRDPEAPTHSTPTVEAANSLLTQPGNIELSSQSPRTTAQARARQTIAEHQQRFEADPAAVEAPALLSAMGNLYRQKLSDYEQAAGCFERLISDYPDDPSVRDAYLQLVICYERLGDLDNRYRTLRRIRDRYPADSPEHEYAAEQLGMVE